jgi:predicted DNA-binding protein YlxM (UPF0122 family)
MLEQTMEMSLMYDYYGALLTGRQDEVFRLYHEDNLSLTDIADELGISKQGVSASLAKAEETLKDSEKKLGLIGKHEEYIGTLAKIDGLADKGDISAIKKAIAKLDI